MPGIVAALRRLKLREPPGVDPTLEVAWFPTLKGGTGPYPGLYVSTKAARMIRPVRLLIAADGCVAALRSLSL
jgi:hypothetical protein